MIKKSVLFASALVGILIGLSGCDFGNGSNSETFNSPAVVDYNLGKGGSTIQTLWGELAVPSTSELAQEEVGECISARITINYDNQPSNAYFTASEIAYSVVEQDNAEVVNYSNQPVITAGYDLPIESLPNEQGASNLVISGKYFLYIAQKATENQKIVYRLACDTTEHASDNQLHNLYLTAKKVETGNGVEKITLRYHAFDVKTLINTIGKDTTLLDSNKNEYHYRYLKANLKYYTGLEEGNPKWNTLTPIEIAIFKNNN